MSFLFAHAKKEVPQFTGLQIQTAVNTLPIPLIYGSPRVQMNIIYANGFRSQKKKSGGGKGMLTGGKGGGTGFDYFATFIGSIGEGILTDIVQIYDNQSIYTVATAPPKRTVVPFTGTDSQFPWTFITSNWPNDAFGYKDTAYLGFEDYPLDSSATIPMLNFVIRGLYAATSPLNLFISRDGTPWLLDADPAQVIFDFMTNERYGAGFPSAYIDTSTLVSSSEAFDPAVGDGAVSTFCQAIGMAWSIVLNNSEPASSILDRWCKNLVVAPVWTGSVLKFIPYWDAYNLDNPGWDASAGIGLKYYKPNVAPLVNLTEDDFLQAGQGEDPVVVTRIDIADAKNIIRGDFKDRSNQFNSNISEQKDETAVELYGPRVDRIGSMDEFTHNTYANSSTRAQLQRSLSVRNTYTFRLDFRWCILDPMDVVTITESSLGLNQFPVRIRSIEEDEKGFLTVVAEEFPDGSASGTIFPQEANISSDFTTNEVPGAVNTPFIFEPTAEMMAFYGQPQNPKLVLGASGGPAGVFDPNWGGCIVNVSNDNITYVQQGTLYGHSRQGVTTASLAAYSGTNPDNTHTLTVNLAESGSTLESVTAGQAADGLSLCGIIDSNGDVEFLGYTTATLVSGHTYNLTGLYRGLFGTKACAHPSGARFLRIDPDVFSAPLSPAFIGQTLYAKLQSFNIYGQEVQDISTCAVYTFAPLGSGTDVRLDPVISALLAGIDVDLNGAQSDTIDLNLGGAGSCAPVIQTVDLEVIA